MMTQFVLSCLSHENFNYYKTKYDLLLGSLGLRPLSLKCFRKHVDIRSRVVAPSYQLDNNGKPGSAVQNTTRLQLKDPLHSDRLRELQLASLGGFSQLRRSARLRC